MNQPIKSGFCFGTAGIFLIAFSTASIFGFLVLDVRDAAFGAPLAAAVLFVAAVDIDRFEIPDLANLAILALGLAWTMEISDFDISILVETLVRIGLAAGFLFAVRAAYRLVRHSEGLGLGDVKLAGAGASWLAWPNIILALLLAAGAAIIVVAVRSLLKGEKMQATMAIPFGAFLAPAIWVAWFAQVTLATTLL